MQCSESPNCIGTDRWLTACHADSLEHCFCIKKFHIEIHVLWYIVLQKKKSNVQPYSLPTKRDEKVQVHLADATGLMWMSPLSRFPD